MMMVVDLQLTSSSLDEIDNGLAALGNEIGVLIKMQLEEIFTSMHRI